MPRLLDLYGDAGVWYDKPPCTCTPRPMWLGAIPNEWDHDTGCPLLDWELDHEEVWSPFSPSERVAFQVFAHVDRYVTERWSRALGDPPRAALSAVRCWQRLGI